MGLPLRIHWGDRLEPGRVPHEPLGRGADQDLATRCCLFEPLRRVDGIARYERGRLVSRHDLACVDPDPDQQLRQSAPVQRGVEALEGSLHVDRCAYGA
jgi:hypothetical protein